jgi:hypothetical protein
MATAAATAGYFLFPGGENFLADGDALRAVCFLEPGGVNFPPLP